MDQRDIAMGDGAPAVLAGADRDVDHARGVTHHRQMVAGRLAEPGANQHSVP